MPGSTTPWAEAVSILSVWPSAHPDCVGAPERCFSKLNTQPACAPVNASRHPLRWTAHDEGSGRFATPFLHDSSIHHSMPVDTSAPACHRAQQLHSKLVGFGMGFVVGCHEVS